MFRKRIWRHSQQAAPGVSDKAACFADARVVEDIFAQQIQTPRLSGIEIGCTSRTPSPAGDKNSKHDAKRLTPREKVLLTRYWKARRGG
jgi:hypothetical protein